MKKIRLTEQMLLPGTGIEAEGEGEHMLRLPAAGGGAELSQLISCKERYLFFSLKVQEEHSAAFQLLVYGKGEREPVFTLRFGILPGVKTPVCIDLQWLGAEELFPEGNAGALKFVCHGRRVEREEISRITLSSMPAFHDVSVWISDMTLLEEYPELPELPDIKLVDVLGQNKQKDWPGKVSDAGELRRRLREMEEDRAEGYPFKDWSEFGGWKGKKLKEGSGFFSSCKAEGRWWLTDPEGYAFFSMGTDCVTSAADCRVDGIEKWMDELPDRQDPEYGGFYREMKNQRSKRACRREGLLYSFFQSNLYRGLGEKWYESWKGLIGRQLRKYGMNTLGNWSDEELFSSSGMPYVTSLPEFPSTKQSIFRDFPDVFSTEYRESAQAAAQALRRRREDPWMIGYFLRNEPSWAFVEHLVLADEVLHNPARTVCKEELVRWLREKYGRIEALNGQWNCSLKDFDDLYALHGRILRGKVSGWTEQSGKDMREFSRRMLRAYVEIPCSECRKVDPNHMILGMRWAWISDSDLVTGWENFDVFSINCYAVDPTSDLQHVADLGVDLPVMIGEFHFGALDAGPSATGLEGVRSQRERGIAFRYYCQRAAAHPNGVGCHYFQCYDQFALGRFDGENYNIGLFDICHQPYQEMLEKVRQCSSEIYPVMSGEKKPAREKAESIPMIAY